MMTEEKLKMIPLGLSNFEKLIQENFVYVDKTKLLHQMITTGSYYFISRPRRFGKSLLISTLESIFSGKKELFNNLWIGSSDYEWKEYPVIKIDFSEVNYQTPEILEKSLLNHLLKIAAQYKISLPNTISAKDTFSDLIDSLAQKGQIAILIDEYDKPINDNLYKTDLAIYMRDALRNFYSTIKAKDAKLRFVILTGVSKFSKTSIFSGLNNLHDITINPNYSALLGYAHDELENYFGSHIKKLAKNLNKDYQETILKLKKQYDGYVFSQDGIPVFNPFSILCCIKDLAVRDYWFATGTPTFLPKFLQSRQIPLNRIYDPIMSERELDTFEPDKINVTALLYQSGYLTIKKYDPETEKYELDFPNYEVAAGLNMLISTACTGLTEFETDESAKAIWQAFKKNDIAGLQKALQTFFNGMTYDTHIKEEYDLKIVLFSMFRIIGIKVSSEVKTSRGIADMVVELPERIYIIELKFNGSTKEALEQIRNREYYEKYLPSKKQIVLLGTNFESIKKKIMLEAEDL